jgi:hypothetical protein
MITMDLTPCRKNMFDDSMTTYKIGKVTSNATKGELKDIQVSKGSCSSYITDSMISAAFTLNIPQIDNPSRTKILKEDIILDIDYKNDNGDGTTTFHGTPSFLGSQIGTGQSGTIQYGELIQEPLNNAKLIFYLD